MDRVDNKKVQLRLSKEQLDQLRERRRTEEAAAESAFRALYASVWLPRVESGTIQIEQVAVGGRPLQATGIHERIMELLTNVGTPKVHGSVTPRKVVERLRLGEVLNEGEAARLGVKAADVRDAFFQFLEPPRLTSAEAIRKAIVRGVAEGTFANTSGYVPGIGPDGRYQVPYDKTTIGRTLSEDEVDFEPGFLMMPAAVPEPPAATSTSAPSEIRETPEVVVLPRPTPDPGTATATTSTSPQTRSSVRLSFEATRDQVFKAFPAIANLAEKADSGKVLIQVQAASADGFDPAWLRNAVEEPLNEADVELRPST